MVRGVAGQVIRKQLHKPYAVPSFHWWHLRTPDNTINSLLVRCVCTVVKLLHLTPVPFCSCVLRLWSPPMPSSCPLCVLSTGHCRERQESEAALYCSLPWFSLGGKFHQLLLGSILHAVTAQQPQASFHKALLFLDKDGTLSVTLINCCQLCTDQKRKASLCKWSPGGVLLNFSGLSSKRFLMAGRYRGGC